VGEIAAEELAALPGMGEASAMLWLDHFYHSGEYDLIVVDSAPTGETLTFLTLPQATEWWITKAFPFQKFAIRTFGLAVRTTTGIPIDKGYEELQALFEKLKVMHEVLSNPAVSSVRLVVNPEKMVIREARRAYTYLQLSGYGVDAVVVNRILPEATREDTGWARYMEAQDRYLEEIDGSFSPLPIFHVPHLRREVFGLPLLEQIGTDLYADRDPTDVFYQEPTLKVTADEGAYDLAIRLPFVEGAEYTARRRGDQFIIQVQNQRRHYLLPQFLTLYTHTETTLEDGWLHARFVAEAEDTE
jgi:arsenite-transporting ATPase